MAFREALAERIRQGLARRKNVEEKKTHPDDIGRPRAIVADGGPIQELL